MEKFLEIEWCLKKGEFAWHKRNEQNGKAETTCLLPCEAFERWLCGK
jgi:hypothetical protein